MKNEKPIYIPWNEVKDCIQAESCDIICSLSSLEYIKKEFTNFNVLENVLPNKNNVKKITMVIGSGKLIDKVKIWKLNNNLDTELFIIPSLWGSGSEVNNIAVTTENNVKVAYVSDKITPTYYSIHPTLHQSIPDNIAFWGYGDTYAHAFEAFISPLITQENQKQAAILIKSLIRTSFTKDIQWFGLSQEASRLQASSSVGLIHAISHILEPLLGNDFSHARLSSIFLYPVFKYNIHKSDKLIKTLHTYEIDSLLVLEKFNLFFEKDEFKQLLPLLNENWPKIIRHPLSRINSSSVTFQSIEWFNQFGEKLE